MSGWRDRGGAGGSVALETALVLPLIALLVTAVTALGRVATDQLVAERLARSTARTVAVTGATATSGVPVGTTVDVRRGAGLVTVQVTTRRSLLGLEHQVHATATAALEPAAS